MRTLVTAALLAAPVALLAPTAGAAHEVLHALDRSRAIAVRAYEPDGAALANAPFAVYSPADPGRPYLEGRTDRNGWLAFVPDGAGSWRVKVVDETGHGLDLAVDAGAAGAAAPPSGAATSGASALRSVAGVAAIAAVFGLLFALYRRKGARP